MPTVNASTIHAEEYRRVSPPSESLDRNHQAAPHMTPAKMQPAAPP